MSKAIKIQVHAFNQKKNKKSLLKKDLSPEEQKGKD